MLDRVGESPRTKRRRPLKGLGSGGFWAQQAGEILQDYQKYIRSQCTLRKRVVGCGRRKQWKGCLDVKQGGEIGPMSLVG